MADSEQKAMQLIAEAEKKLKGNGGLFGFLGGGSKVNEACELYCRAGNMYKMAKKWSAAGSAFNTAGTLHLGEKYMHDAATCFVDAGNCYKKCEPQKAVDCLMKAIEIYIDMGRFTMAAKHHMTIAELYENELADLDKSMKHYEMAADYYRGEESNSSANKCLLQVAKYAAQLSRYEKAIEIYEGVASSCLDSSLLKYSAKDYLFRAVICHLCVDVLNASHALNKYDEMCPSFADSRECKLIKTLITKLDDQDMDGFTAAIADYDKISRLDNWYTTLLLRVKKQLQETTDLC